jgi:hypothetical protein
MDSVTCVNASRSGRKTMKHVLKVFTLNRLLTVALIIAILAVGAPVLAGEKGFFCGTTGNGNWIITLRSVNANPESAYLTDLSKAEFEAMKALDATSENAAKKAYCEENKPPDFGVKKPTPTLKPTFIIPTTTGTLMASPTPSPKPTDIVSATPINKPPLCHNGIKISPNDASYPAHFAHGDLWPGLDDDCGSDDDVAPTKTAVPTSVVVLPSSTSVVTDVPANTLVPPTVFVPTKQPTTAPQPTVIPPKPKGVCHGKNFIGVNDPQYQAHADHGDGPPQWNGSSWSC